MTAKQRVHAALEGRPVDRPPATALYNFLYHCDHFAELTGRPAADLWRWKHAPPEDHVATYRTLVERAPFEVLQPQPAPPREAREATEVVEEDGATCLRDRRTGDLRRIQPVSGHAYDDRANERQTVFDTRDADEQIRIPSAEALIAAGHNDYLEAAVAAFGRDHFILSGGVCGPLWCCHGYVGLTNLLAMMLEAPDLVEHMSQRLLERNLAVIHQLAAAGGDAIYVDDALATSDMISVRHYERFCLPYTAEMVREIHRVGHKAIVLYFGGIADRLEPIASLGADALSMETTMKGYVNDLGQIAEAIGGRVSLFGNLDPVGVLERGTDERLAAEVRRQADAGRKARGFIHCTGSPITPGTPLRRVLRFLELGRAQ